MPIWSPQHNPVGIILRQHTLGGLDESMGNIPEIHHTEDVIALQSNGIHIPDTEAHCRQSPLAGNAETILWHVGMQPG